MKKLTLTAVSALTFASSSLFAENVVAVYDLKGAVRESGAASGSIMSVFSRPDRPITHYDLVESLNFAIYDNKVKAVVLDVDDASFSLAQVQELHRLIVKLREKKKDVWLYTEYYNITTALLGSACNHFTVMPEGHVSLKGLYSESMYFKGLLDKIGVKMEVVHIGDFKSAGETFYRNSPSDPAKKQMNELFDSIFTQITEQISTSRGIEKDALMKFINLGLPSAKDLLKYKLVDHLDYRTDFIAKVRKAYGDDTKFNRSYELPNTKPPKIDGIMDLFKMMKKSNKEESYNSPYIAVIPLEGGISDASVAPVRTAILKATRDKMCKGVVLRVNSPGGSALASDVLWEATDEFKKTGRPFVVSMGSVAASGGYYVAAGADHIFAEQGTITGSIGVVGMKPVFGGGMQKLGINIHSTKRGKHADLLNTTRSYTDTERSLIRKSMLEVYGVFKKRITDGRGKRIKGDLEKLAGGRVYSGKDALKHGLVDQLGGLNEAINKAADLAKLEEFETHQFPKPKSALEGLFGNSGSDKEPHEFIRVEKVKTGTNSLQQLLINDATIHLLGHEKREQLNYFFNQIQSCQKHHIQLIAPATLQPMMK